MIFLTKQTILESQLTHLFPVQPCPISTKHQKTIKFSNGTVFFCFQGVEKGKLGTNGLIKVKLLFLNYFDIFNKISASFRGSLSNQDRDFQSIIESFKLKSFSLFTVCYHPLMEFTGSALFAGKDRLQISLQILCEFKQIYLSPLKLSENRFCDVFWGNRSHHINSLNTRSQIQRRSKDKSLFLKK